MSLLQDMTYISLRGSKESVIRMLNAVIRNVGGGDIITDSDDLETINSKIKDEKDGYGFRISIPDLLDDKCMEDSRLLEKKAAYEVSKGDEEFSTDERMIDILGVYLHEGGFEVEFEMYECENCAYYSDWLGWGDIARVYGCKVLVDNDLYRNGRFEDFCGTTVYMPKGESVEESRITPELNVYRYSLEFDKLIELSPENYRQRMIRCMEKKINELKGFINSEKLLIVKESLELNDGRAEIPEGVTAIDGLIFAGCKELRSIFIPASVKYIDTNAFWGSNLESIEVHPDNPNFCVESNCLLSKDKSTLLIGFKDSAIPSSVTRIEENAFSGCPCADDQASRYPEPIRIGDSGEDDEDDDDRTAGNELIDENGHAVIPEGTAEIEEMTFEDCRGLVSVEIPGSVREIRMGAFIRCTGLTSIVIPEGVTTIADMAFRGCQSLVSVSIPESIEEISFDAFEGCPCEDEILEKYKDIIG